MGFILRLIIMDAKNIMKDNDLVIVYLNKDKIDMIQLNPSDPKSFYNGKFGTSSHSLFIGKPYGSKIWSSNDRDFLYALRPTSQLITKTLAHRTQIIFAPDIPFIVSSLEVHNGSIIIESGTGNGSLSTVLQKLLSLKDIYIPLNSIK